MPKQNLDELLTQYFSIEMDWKNIDEPITPLIKIVDAIRPKKSNKTISISSLLHFLKSNEIHLSNFKHYINQLFQNRSFKEMLIDIGISSANSFKDDLVKKITDKVLPEHGNPLKMKYLFDAVFYKKNDSKWLINISRSEIVELLDLVGTPNLNDSYKENGVLYQIYYSIMVLSIRASGIALERDIRNMLPEYENQKSAFLALHKEVEYIFDKQSKAGSLLSTESIDFKQIKVILSQCLEYLEKAYKASETNGISLKTNKDLNRIREQLTRIEFILPLISENPNEDPSNKTVDLFYSLLEIYRNKIQLFKFIGNASQMFAHEITSHKAKTGEKYISKSKLEYYSMLKAAIGGGVIVGVLCITKVLLSKVNASDFGYAFLYSANYAIGFVLIYLLGFTLATKQPAMTASTLMGVIEKGLHLNVKPTIRYRAFAQYFAQLIRTQFIAFIGNVVAAFPIALLGTFLIYIIDGYDIAGKKWPTLLNDLNPIESAAIFHAAIAGLFLFISGVISGYIANRNKFYKISERLAHNSLIRRTLGIPRAKKLQQWYDKKWAGIMSNVWFGIFMGSTASIGVFLGLNLDVRHITFASGNFALGLFGANYQVSTSVIFWSILGIGIIGFMNFIVSFMLSLFLAFRAKNIPLAEIKPILVSVLNEIYNNPISFVYPKSILDEDDKSDLVEP